MLRATTLYLSHPINQALNAKYKGKLTCLSENVQGGVRCDVTWKWYNDQTRTYDTIAVLEVKRRGVLLWDDFRAAQTDAAGRHTKMEEAYSNACEGGGRFVATALRNNAVYLSSQASAYALRQHTKFVALFDWDSLFLFQLNEMGKKFVGDCAYGTRVEGKDPGIFSERVFLDFWLPPATQRGIPRQ